jgi:hypothetical protein
MAAAEGIAMLQQGVQVVKFGRDGKAHAASLKLSQDLADLSWTSNKLSNRLARSTWRSIKIGQVGALAAIRHPRALHSSAHVPLLPQPARIATRRRCRIG